MSKKMKIVMISLLVAVSMVVSFSAGCVLIRQTVSTTDSHLEAVNEAWNIIFRDYVDQSQLDASKLSQAAIKGMVEAVNDPYTVYLDPEAYQSFSSSLQGKFEGIGATVGVKNGQIQVIAPISGSPAEKAGIRAGDIILGVNGESIEGLSPEEVISLIRGPKGTSVRVTVQHQGESTPVELEIVRAELDLPSVFFEMRGDIAYIRLYQFTDRTDSELSPVLERLAQENATGIVLDLRSNPGGYLNAVVDVASHFLKDGVVVYVVDNKGEETSYKVKSTSVTTDLPLVVLTDNFSASGSEVLAGAIQDYKRGIVAGTRTYGKGSADTLHELADGSAIYITIARWLTPNRRLIEGKGIEPDYELALEGDDAIEWAINYLKGQK